MNLGENVSLQNKNYGQEVKVSRDDDVPHCSHNSTVEWFLV